MIILGERYSKASNRHGSSGEQVELNFEEERRAGLAQADPGATDAADVGAEIQLSL